jgi:hypothetical protein
MAHLSGGLHYLSAVFEIIPFALSGTLRQNPSGGKL